MQKILITGAAGFVGFHTAQQLLAQGAAVFGYDNMDDYYDVSLKEARLAQLTPHKNFQFLKADLEDWDAMEGVFKSFQPDIVIHLAAQAGVRYSIDHPRKYVDSNLTGFINILEACRHYKPAHLVYASSSSVYGANKKVPFSESDPVDNPVSLYAATKKANELMAHSYVHLYGLNCTGLRFFTVYGPWGRPDMAYFKFAKAITAGQPIDVYNHGDMKRDFTYIDDIVDGIIRVTKLEQGGNKLYNIGNNEPETLMDMIKYLEEALGQKATLNMLPMQPGDVPSTFADIDKLKADTGFAPTTDLKSGLEKFAAWFREYYS